MNLVEKIKEAVNSEISKEANQIFDRHKKEMNDEIERLRAGVIMRTVIRISESISFHDLGRTIRIDIIKNEKENS